MDDKGRPLVVYHGSNKKFYAFSHKTEKNRNHKGNNLFFTSDKETANGYGDSNVIEAYLKITDPSVTYSDGEGFSLRHTDASFEYARSRGADGIIAHDVIDSATPSVMNRQTVYVVFEPTQIKSAIGNNGNFDGTNPDIRYSRAQTASQSAFSIPEPSKMDDVIYAMQDKQVDLRRVVQSIKKAGGKLADNINAYLQEELFHGRASKGVHDFLNNELRPLAAQMRSLNVDMADFEEYLWNKHAEERNKQIAKINDQMPDGGSGIKTADARAYLGALAPGKKSDYE